MRRTIFAAAGFLYAVTANLDFIERAFFEKESDFPAENTTYKNATITYSGPDMNCENCIRAGFDFCLFRTFPNQTTHGQFTNCSDYAITPEKNSELSVNETTRWICSSAF